MKTSWMLLVITFVCIGGISVESSATPNYPCACGALTVAPEGVILPANSGFQVNGATIVGTCDTANGYYSSCSAPSGAATIDPDHRDSFPSCSQVSDTITYTCSGTEWVTSDSCGNSSCEEIDYGGRGKKGKTASGSKGELNCGDDYKDPPTYYCRNGTWSFTDEDGGGGTGSNGVCDICPMKSDGNRKC